MHECPSCGNVISDYLKYCTNCGTIQENVKILPTMSADEAYAAVEVLKWSKKPRPLLLDPDDYPYSAIHNKYRISNPRKFHEDLINNGYLEAAPVTEALRQLNIDEIKTILRNHALPVSGSKDTLVNRAFLNIPDLAFDVDTVYTLTDLGQAHLDEYGGFGQFWSLYHDVEYTEYERIRQKNPDLSPADILYIALLNKWRYALSEHQYYYVRSIMSTMARAFEISEMYKDALQILIARLAYTLSGMPSYPNYSDDVDDVKQDNDPDPKLMEKIYSLRGYFQPSMLDFWMVTTGAHVPYAYFTKKEFEAIVYDALENGGTNAADYKRYAD